jgi:hypothetical protein
MAAEAQLSALACCLPGQLIPKLETSQQSRSDASSQKAVNALLQGKLMQASIFAGTTTHAAWQRPMVTSTVSTACRTPAFIKVVKLVANKPLLFSG